MRRQTWDGLVGVSLMVCGLLTAGPSMALAEGTDAQAVLFNRDIRPILSENCFACHGPDKGQRKADLRLDVEQEAFADRGGYHALVARKPDESELLHRITAKDQGSRMPPAKFGKKLTTAQIDLIRRWIEQGAKWQKHWSLIAAQRPPLPRTSHLSRARNAIDHFILARLEREKLQPSPEADRRTLLRRLAFDLTGLPPAPEQVDAYLADPSPEAYERLVDQLLASPHYGERMAIYWLDLVRFADTGGYHSDNHRDISLYRDYVIKAFNDNKRFDRFTVEQLAGDLLPGATSEDRIASGYNRLLQTTEEGGAQAKEYTAKYAADRVRNVSTVWLGTTLGCAECHNHKFDPFTTQEFYRFEAFFADIQEKAVGRQEQTKIPTPAQAAELRRLDQEMAALQQTLSRQTPELDAAQVAWEAQMRTQRPSQPRSWIPARLQELASTGGTTLVVQNDLSVLATGKNPVKDTYTVTLPTDRKHITGIRLEALTHPTLANKSLSRANGNFVLTSFEVEAISTGQTAPKPVKLTTALADFSQSGFPIAAAIDRQSSTGWAVEGHRRAENHTAVFVFAQPLAGGPGTTLIIRLKHESTFRQHNIGRFRLALTSVDKPDLADKGDLPDEVIAALAVEPASRTAAQKEAVAKQFRSVAPQLEPTRKQLAALQRRKEQIDREMPTTLVSMSVPPRVVRVLSRGNWLDDSGDVVTPAVPAALPPLPVQDRRATRLDLARWLVAPENPLVARVFVNRLWKLAFGQGIVKTLDDFGSQGTWPTHLELLDWLAVEFRASGWNVKHLLKLMVMSATYRQSSQSSEELRQRDPYNRWLARQARFRLDAEMVRDNALAIGGLLSRKVGGPSVKPYQPAGYWMHLNFPKREYQNDHGEDQYRRGVYTYWQRTFIHPSLLAFDAPSREECTVERPRSNTPLQALVLLNDPTYVEASRALAERMLREGGKDNEARIQFAYRQALCRKAQPQEVELLLALIQQHSQQYRAERAAAEALLGIGDRPTPKDIEPAELAAWTSVARVILNLHETITRN